jgi:hypothetical protein
LKKALSPSNISAGEANSMSFISAFAGRPWAIISLNRGKYLKKNTIKSGEEWSAAEPNRNTNTRKRKQSHLAEFSTLHFLTQGAEYNIVRSFHPKIV